MTLKNPKTMDKYVEEVLIATYITTVKKHGHFTIMKVGIYIDKYGNLKKEAVKVLTSHFDKLDICIRYAKKWAKNDSLLYIEGEF